MTASTGVNSLLLAMLSLAPAQATRADFIIDTFNNPTYNPVTGAPGQSASVSGSPHNMTRNTMGVSGIIGGTRTVQVDNGNSGGKTMLEVNPGFPLANRGKLAFSQDTNVRGNAAVVWDGDMINGLSGHGFAPQDITQGGANNAMEFLLGADISGTMVTFTIYTGGEASLVLNNPMRTATFTIPAPQSPLTTFVLPFSSFAGSGDLTKVVGASLSIDGSSSADVSIDYIGAVTTVPEPSTIVLCVAAALWLAVGYQRLRQPKLAYAAVPASRARTLRP